MSGARRTSLDDLRVVEISDRIAGAYCGKLLVDAGADVVKVEPASGDRLRRFTVTGATPPRGADSPLFSYLNAGKRGVTAFSWDLVFAADVVVTASRRRAIDMGMDPQRLLDAARQCVVITISDFGWTGPWAGRAATESTEIPELQFQIGRWKYRDWIRERIGPWMRERTVNEIVELGQLFACPSRRWATGRRCRT